MKVGIIGEDPNDTEAVVALLKRMYGRRIIFKILVRNIKGHQLDSNKIERALVVELKHEKFHTLIYVRDLDGLASEKSKVNNKNKWFQNLNKLFGEIGVFMLNIFEIEALILADIEAFNLIYKVSIVFKGDPMLMSNPKEFLMEKTKKAQKKYSENDCPMIFSKIRIKTIFTKHKHFQKFIQEFTDRIKISPVLN